MGPEGFWTYRTEDVSPNLFFGHLLQAGCSLSSGAPGKGKRLPNYFLQLGREPRITSSGGSLPLGRESGDPEPALPSVVGWRAGDARSGLPFGLKAGEMLVLLVQPGMGGGIWDESTCSGFSVVDVVGRLEQFVPWSSAGADAVGRSGYRHPWVWVSFLSP